MSGVASAELKQASFCTRLSLTFCNEADTEAVAAVDDAARADRSAIEVHAVRVFAVVCVFSRRPIVAGVADIVDIGIKAEARSGKEDEACGIDFFEYLTDVINRVASMGPKATADTCRDLLPDK